MAVSLDGVMAPMGTLRAASQAHPRTRHRQERRVAQRAIRRWAVPRCPIIPAMASWLCTRRMARMPEPNKATLTAADRRSDGGIVAAS